MVRCLDDAGNRNSAIAPARHGGACPAPANGKPALSALAPAPACAFASHARGWMCLRDAAAAATSIAKLSSFASLLTSTPRVSTSSSRWCGRRWIRTIHARSTPRLRGDTLILTAPVPSVPSSTTVVVEHFEKVSDLTLAVILRENVPHLNYQSHQQCEAAVKITINFMIEIRVMNT